MTNQIQKIDGQEITETGKPVSKFDSFRSSMADKKKSIEKVLPAHISFEKFQSVVLTACMQNGDLLTAHRPSMMLACVNAATDGLLPDGREAALVIFNSKIGKDDSGRDVWGKKVQYMPMYAGILKKVRQSEELASIDVQVVYSKDTFKHSLGDDMKITHEVNDGNDRGEFKAVYCIARLKDGTVMKEVMYKDDVEKIRRSSKAGAMTDKDLKYNKGAAVGDPKGIWAEWYEEMAKKTVFRRLAKWLPQSVDKDGNEIRLFDNDDSMEILDQHEESVTWDENGEATPEGNNQPDLKQIAAEKKAASKVEEKTADNEESDQTDAEPAETSDEEVEDETPETEKTLLQIEADIRKIVNEATNSAELSDILSVEYADDLARMEKEQAGKFKKLNDLITDKIKTLQAGE